uniref:WAP domain-containing protein n=1 Tax=Caenorhabditis japonica TaxID=281687 RepID=A0A8R1I213_CAEJA
MIQLLLIGVTVVGAQHMTLCDYYEKLGLAKPECGHIVNPHQNFGFINPTTFNAPNSFRCNSDADCRGSSTTASMCCPTGCNYNMCVHVGAQVLHPRRSIVFNSLSPISGGDQCPDPYQLDIKCVAARGANWCYTDADCRSGLYTRKCCATNCGYNTCLMKFNEKWIIA